MPTIRLSKELYEYLEHSSDGASMDSTIRRLLHLGLLRGRIVQKQVNRKLITGKVMEKQDLLFQQVIEALMELLLHYISMMKEKVIF